MITICFDFGNTRLKAAVFENNELRLTEDITEDSLSGARELLKTYQPANSILSSVIDHNPRIDEMLNEKTKFHRLSHLTKLNFTIPSNKPETVGADRLALMAAAVHFYPEKNFLVIGMGSCITYNFIN